MHSDPIFRNGGPCNPDAKIRELANRKVQRTIRIGNLFGAKHLIYPVARDGFEVSCRTEWDHVYEWMAEGLNGARDYIRKQEFGNYESCTIEPDGPRGQSFIPNAGYAVGFIQNMLDDPEFWGVDPKLLSREAMASIDPVLCVNYLISMGKLHFLHFSNQIARQFDNGFPPLVGPSGLKEAVEMFSCLMRRKWRGVVEFDCNMLRAGVDPMNPVWHRKRFIQDCSLGLSIALMLAKRVYLLNGRSFASDSLADLNSIMRMCALDEGEVEDHIRLGRLVAAK